MNDLRAAAQQALEALEWYADYSVADVHALDAAAALRAALAEPEGGGNSPPPLQEATVQQQIEDTPPSDYRRGYWDGFAIGKREGRIEAEDALAEPVQEPVAWIHADPDKPGLKFLEWREDAFGYEGEWIKTPLYTAPPQRKPLSDEEIQDCWQQRHRDKATERRLITRAIERAHGIGGSNESA